MRQTTKDIMSDVLISKLETKPLSKISVKEIADCANVNRQTFYYHFKDIYDLLGYSMQREAEFLLERAENASWDEILLEIAEFLEDRRAMCLRAIEAAREDTIRKFVYSLIQSYLRVVLDEASAGMNIDEQYKDFLTSFLVVSVAGNYVEWIKTPDSARLSCDKFVKYLSITVVGSSKQALIRYEKEMKTNN